jgi:ArsR family transcriptional regulator, cadmium/lead-responsive transcriptional repressor
VLETAHARLAPEGVALKAKVFRGFADPSRLAILEELRGGARTVSELVAATGLSQPNASNHLACLYECGLVLRERDGRNVRYRLRDDRVPELLRVVDELLADVAEGIYACTRYAPP